MSDRVLETLLSFLIRYRMKRNVLRTTRESLGHGGYGDVVLGELLPPDRRAGTKVAVKQLRGTGTKAECDRTVIVFARELKVWAGVSHPHVVPLVGFYLSKNRDVAWLISPYMKYGNIREYLSVRKPPQLIRTRLLRETTDGICYLHGLNICHGDIKSGNILIDDDHHARLCDFGLAKIIESAPSGLTTSKGLGGSIRYMAPQLLSDDRPMRTTESDIWALACTALEILVDKLPYGDVVGDGAVVLRIARGDLPAEVDTLDIPTTLKPLLNRCWAADPADRPDITTCLRNVCESLDEEELKMYAFVFRHVPLCIHTIPWRCFVSTVDGAEILPRSLDVQSGMNGSQDLARGITDEPNPRRRGSETGSTSQLPIGTHILNQEVDYYREELLHRPVGHPNRDSTLQNLGILLLNKYRKNGDVAHLDEAIDVHHQALLLRPEGHSERHTNLHSLGTSLWHKYRESGDVAQLDEAIDVYHQALLLRPAGHSERHNSLQNLGILLLDKYRKNGDVAHLDEAIDLYRQALLLRPEGHSERHHTIHGLGFSLADKYREHGDVANLDEGISFIRPALNQLPIGHPQRNYTQPLFDQLVVMRSSAAIRNMGQGTGSPEST